MFHVEHCVSKNLEAVDLHMPGKQAQFPCHSSSAVKVFHVEHPPAYNERFRESDSCVVPN